jgi:signal transduction histidine kinase
MIFELKDDAKEDSFDAVGVTIYSDSKTIVSSYVAIFESLWKQTELYEHIKEVNSKYLILNRELSTAYDKLKMQEKMQKEFINIAAHELKTPIMPIMGVSEMIESKLRNGKKKIFLDSRKAQIVIRNAKRLEQLSQDILDITRIESNTLRLRKQMVNIKEIIYALLQDFGNQLNERNIKINRKHVEDIFVEADKGRLNQVIANLLSNAIKFTENGVITITARKQNSSNRSSQHTNKRLAIVSIKDTGYGIDQEVLTKLFSKFATKSEKGMGLGLYISKNIIEAHGGRIWAENNIDGKGATLTFTIPIRSLKNELGNNCRSSVGEVAPAVEAE